jgi:hypothetical protein
VDTTFRPAFNAAYTDDLYRRFLKTMEDDVGPVHYRVAETPLFMTAALRDDLARAASEIVALLSQPARVEAMKRAIPARFNVPNMDNLPNTTQVDFALCAAPGGGLTGRVVELQGFPSLYALMDVKTASWEKVLEGHPVLGRRWTSYMGRTPEEAREHIRRAFVGDEDPEHVCLVDIYPEQQKTSGDFWATKRIHGIDTCCLTKLIKRGRRLYRLKDGREVPVKRIYNRVVFDELEAKKVEAPFRWDEELEVSWCSHPNWYWTWSKYSLPGLDHPAVPRTTYLSDLPAVPANLQDYVLKPLFSFAGTGVKVDVTEADLEAVPAAQRHLWVLQEKVTYVGVLPMPDGTPVKGEVRVMLVRAPGEQTLTPRMVLVRLSRGKMIGVDQNKDLTWVGGTVGMWPADAA